MPCLPRLQVLTGSAQNFQKSLAKLVNNTVERTDPRVIDLLWHFPTGINDRRNQTKHCRSRTLARLSTIEVTVTGHVPPPHEATKKFPYRVFCADDTGEIELVFFRGQQNYLERMLPMGQKDAFCQAVSKRYGSKAANVSSQIT